MSAPAAFENAAVSTASGVGKCCSALGSCTKKCCGVFGGWVKRLPARTVSILLRVVNICNAVLLGLACFYAYRMTSRLTRGGTVSVTRAFLSTYIGIFGLLLFLFETRVRYSSACIRKNFGFLFTYTGRAIFLIFLGAVCFGMLGDDGHSVDKAAYAVCLVVGLLTVGNAIFNCFIICNHPEFQKMNENNNVKAGGDPSKMSEEQIAAYLREHPELAAAVAGSNKDASSASDVAIEVDASSSRGMFGGFGATGFGAEKPAYSNPYEPPTTTYVPPVVAAPAAYVTPAAVEPLGQQPQSAFAVADEDENPFASKTY